MADVPPEKSLDDFFAKRDKKKKKEKGKGKESVAGPASSAVKKNKKEKEKSTKNESQDSQIEKEDEEWKEFEQKEVDYSGLRLQALQISDEKEEEEYEKEEVGEDGEIILVSGDKVSGPWNKSGVAPPPVALVDFTEKDETGEMKAHSGQVAVFVRFRPTPNFAHSLIECLPDGKTVNIYYRKDSRRLHNSKNGQLSPLSFQVEGVLQNVSQEEVYSRVCQQVVQGALDGYNGTVMCFGQTGAGKTYTITGSTGSYKQRGIIPRALQEVFQEVVKRTEHSFSVHLSYLEIYNESLVDLLSPVQGSSQQFSRGMVVMEEPGKGVFIRGLSLHPVHREEDALNLLFESEGQIVKEATYINKSLSFLEQAILALADSRREHVPFRQTKLTHALKDSLGGNCNTVFVANIYGEAAQIEETLSTLRFASRMKCVRIDPAVNEHTDPALQIKKLQKEVQMLKEELSICNTLEWDARGTNEDAEASMFGASAQSQKQHPNLTKEKPIKSRDKPSQNKRQGEGIPFSRKQMESASKSKLNSVQTPERQQVTQPEPDTECSDTQEPQQPGNEPFYVEYVYEITLVLNITVVFYKPSSLLYVARFPPSKADAFEDFKLGKGSKINCILKENKAVLLERHGLLRQLAEEVNTVKREIDCTVATIQQHTAVQETQGQFLDIEGELLLQLRDLKALYRQRREALYSIKAEVNYCQHLVDQCRVRLLSEFETWYKNTFLLPEEELEMTKDKTLAQEENNQQCLEQLENNPLSDRSSAESFYSARCRTLKRQRNTRVPSCVTPVQTNPPAGSGQGRLSPVPPVK
ncbi:Kinesin-like protein KIF9 [Channa argus]|uniref:Kinesin-like protein KIF9 n=1 Tax=Channa argus TaxID=215402 RepID=A0A6G1QM37_CHAAH|nr:Kinesin-like protein KIF9 [Channa argus]